MAYVTQRKRGEPVVPRKRPQHVPGLWRRVARLAAQKTLRRGDAVEAFEDRLSERLQGRQVTALGSGRYALLMVLRALEVPVGSTVVLASYNASCVPNALQAAGYVPLFVDVDPETLVLDPACLPKKPPKHLGALILTHIEGSPAPITEARRWVQKFDVPLIEDAAHALGATIDDQPVGTLGDAAIFSLGRGKHLNTLGGGLAVTRGVHAAQNLAQLAERLPVDSGWHLLRQALMETMVVSGTHPSLYAALALPALRIARRFGIDPMTMAFEDPKDALSAVPGSWARRLSNLQAELGLAGLDTFDRALARRRQIADRLREALADTLRLQRPLPTARPAWLELTARVPEREAFQRQLLARGVDTQRTWMDACHALPGLAGPEQPDCPNATQIAREAVYLPTYAGLTPAQVAHTISAVQSVAGEARG